MVPINQTANLSLWARLNYSNAQNTYPESTVCHFSHENSCKRHNAQLAACKPRITTSLPFEKVCTCRSHNVKIAKSDLSPSSYRELKLYDKSTSPEVGGIDFQQHTFSVSVLLSDMCTKSHRCNSLLCYSPAFHSIYSF